MKNYTKDNSSKNSCPETKLLKFLSTGRAAIDSFKCWECKYPRGGVVGLLSLSDELCLAALRPLLKEQLGGAVLIDLDVVVALSAQIQTPGKGLKVSDKTNPAPNNTDKPIK